MITEVYNIEGMSCAACSSAVERVTRKLAGVSQSSVNLTTAKMTITYDETQVTREKIEEKVGRAGFKAINKNLRFLHPSSSHYIRKQTISCHLHGSTE